MGVLKGWRSLEEGREGRESAIARAIASLAGGGSAGVMFHFLNYNVLMTLEDQVLGPAHPVLVL